MNLYFIGVYGNHIGSKRGQFVIRIGYNGLVFRSRCLTFLGIDPRLIFFRVACLVFLGTNCRLAFFPSLCHFFFSSIRFLVLLSVSGFLKLSKNLKLNSKLGRHSSSVKLFISKVIFPLLFSRLQQFLLATHVSNIALCPSAIPR